MLDLLNPYKWLLIGGAFVLAVGAAGVAGIKVGTKFTQARWDAAVVAEAKGQAAALKSAAEAIALIEVKSETHIQPLRTEIRTNTVYRECKHSDDSLRNLNSLITGSEPAGNGVVPAPNRAR